ncbi:uncharacterized protein [Macrobrachium rosenbergii]|uniref:uncharacterized protein n=1 Tax=Macrobrachium rosenbergii TaxID=79674 RepID=UPI0034D549D3
MQVEYTESGDSKDEGDNPEDCDVCSCPFNSENRRPRCLPCCHTFCTQCIAKMIVLRHVSCPKCRERHYATSASQFPANFSLESLMRKLKARQVSSFGGDATLPGKTEPSSRMEEPEHSVRQQIERVQNLSSVYREMGDRLSESKRRASALINEHKEQLKRIESEELKQRRQGFQKLSEENAAVLLLLQEKLECLSTLSQEGIEKCLGLTASLLSLSLMPTQKEKMNQALAECDRCICIQDAWLEKCKVTLSDDRAAKASQEVLARTRDALSVTSLTGDIERSRHSSSIKVEDLLEMGEGVKSLLKDGRVFALHHKTGEGEEGRPRFAKVSLHGQKDLCLHHLQEREVPLDATILSYNEIYKLADTKETITFLDFGWDGAEHGRVQIRLQPADTGRARQFALLCTGLWGPTYANTRLLAVGNRGAPSEFVRGGDYQHNNGTGGASLLPGLKRGGEYWRRQVSGSVMAAGSWGDACSAQFIISTRNPGSAQRDDTIFGQVEDGLPVLNAAIKDGRITRVNVTDCGIMIPL